MAIRFLKRGCYPRKHGYIYLLLLSDGTYRIGKTKLMETRLQNYRSQLGVSGFQVLHIMETGDTDAAETYMHHVFAAQRIYKRHELFKLTAQDVEWIQSHNELHPEDR